MLLTQLVPSNGAVVCAEQLGTTVLQVFFELDCDACGDKLPVLSGEASVVQTRYTKLRAEALYGAIRLGWFVSRTTTLCPDCAGKLGAVLKEVDENRSRSKKGPEKGS